MSTLEFLTREGVPTEEWFIRIEKPEKFSERLRGSASVFALHKFDAKKDHMLLVLSECLKPSSALSNTSRIRYKPPFLNGMLGSVPVEKTLLL